MIGLFESSLSLSENRIEQIGWVLIHSFWQFALVALVAVVIMRLMNKRSPSARHAVLVGFMAISILLPIATWSAHSNRIARIAQSAVIEVESIAPTPASAETQTIAESTEIESQFPAPKISAEVPELETQTLPTEATETIAPQTTWAYESVATMRPWLRPIVGLWAIGVLLCSLRPILGWLTLRRLKTVGTSAASQKVLSSMLRVSRRMGLTRSIEVLESTLAQVPMVVGYFRPIILLPFSLLTSIPTAQLEAILAHELAHIRRHDFVINLLQILVETVFFYHPAVWWLSNRIRIEREHCCDDLVVKVMDNRSDYGRALIAIAELRGRSSALSLSASDGSLVHRIRRITGTSHERNGFAAWTSTCLVAGLAGAVLFLSMASNKDAMAMSDEAGIAGVASMTSTESPNDETESDSIDESSHVSDDDVTTLTDPAFRLPGHSNMECVAFDTNDTELVQVSTYHAVSVRRWDLKHKKLLSDVKLTCDKHFTPFRAGTFKLSGDTKQVIGATDEYVGIWDTASGPLRWRKSRALYQTMETGVR